MKTSEILVIPKMTKLEFDMHRLKLTEKDLLRFYKTGGVDSSKIIDSHNRQKESLGKLKDLLKGASFVERDRLTKDLASKYKLVISFGGDNHFSYLSHFISDQLMIGINSDSVRSDGALTSCNVEEFGEKIENLLSGNFNVEEWARLKLKINNKAVEDLAISEVFIGEESRFNMSRHILNLNSLSEEQKGSGLIIATGVGSTGWYNSASKYLFKKGDIFPKTSREARFILTEPHEGKIIHPKLLNGSFKEGEKLEIISLSDSQAVLSVDSIDKINIKEGSKIVIELGKPLKVVRLK